MTNYSWLFGLEPGSISSQFRSQKRYLNSCSFRNFAHKHDRFTTENTFLLGDKITNLLLWIFWNCVESFFSIFFGLLKLRKVEIVIRGLNFHNCFVIGSKMSRHLPSQLESEALTIGICSHAAFSRAQRWRRCMEYPRPRYHWFI